MNLEPYGPATCATIDVKWGAEPPHSQTHCLDSVKWGAEPPLNLTQPLNAKQMRIIFNLVSI